MRHLSATSRPSGFTLIEVLVVAPVIIIIISGFVALIIALVGDVMQSRDQTLLVHDTQEALNRVEEDIRLTTQFLTTTSSLTAPQGSNSNFTGTAAFAQPGNYLILNTLATTANPITTSRNLVYYAQVYGCGTQMTYNNILLTTVVYFMKDGSLWRRTIVPSYNTNASPDVSTVCQAPWQQNSCSPGYSTSGTPCQTNDVEIMKNVGSFSIAYYATAGSTFPLGSGSAPSASTAVVTIVGQKTVAGRNISSTIALRATKINVPVNQ